MKKIVLLMSLVGYGTMMAQGPSKDEIFLEKVDLIALTRKVQQEGGATVRDVEVAVRRANGDYEEEADQAWWEMYPRSGCIISFATGVGVTAFYFLNYR